jgi:hypothetical protein
VLSGGGIYNTTNASLWITNSSFYENTATDPVHGSGGSIMNAGTLVVQGSVFYNDTVPYWGAGIWSQATGSLAVTNSTFFSESSSVGGALFIESNGTNVITNSTIADNAASSFGGGIVTLDDLTLQNTIVASNTAPSGGNCSGTITDGGNNLVWGDTTCPGINANPHLVSLDHNGGPTLTMALTIVSSAIDKAKDATCPAFDQRGVTRPQGPHCDIGAFELVYYPVFLPLLKR